MSSRYDDRSICHAHYHGIGRIFGKAQLTRARLNDPSTGAAQLLRELLDEIMSVEHDIDNREGEK